MFIETTKMEGKKERERIQTKEADLEWCMCLCVCLSVCLRWDWGKDSRGLKLCQSFLRP